MYSTYIILILSAIGFAAATSEENIDLKFTMDGSEINLNLQRNHHIPSNFEVILGKNGDFKRWDQFYDDDFAVYVDRNKSASFMVTRENTEEGELTPIYQGIFRIEEEDYVLEPVRSEGTRRKRSSISIDLGDFSKKEHIIYKPDIEIVYDKESELKGKLQDLPEEEWMDYVNTSRSDDPLKHHMEVEVMLVLDYAIFAKWIKNSQAGSQMGKENDAINKIRHYFSHVINGVDLRYMNIQENDFSLHVKLIGMFIAMTPEDSSWTEKRENKDADTPFSWSHAYRALDDFEKWIDVNKDTLPQFDQATLISGNYLFGGYTNGRHRRIGGLADIKGVCSFYRASINHDGGIYAVTQTAAHEMAHNLGALHDGSYSGNSCDRRDQYIMASSPGTLTDVNYKNAYEFSSCSVDYMRSYLTFLIETGKNCLLNEGSNAPEFFEQLKVLPGQKYSLDVQCQVIYGYESYHCAGGIQESKICRELHCYDPELRRCTYRAEQRAASGTTCGNKKWCAGGDCVVNENAPEAKDYCIYGDFKAVLSNGETCENYIKEKPWECYHEYYGAECCGSCAKLAENSTTDCKYGDKGSFCSTISAHNCYQDSTKQSCCSSCKRFNSTIPGCEFGDRARWCSNLRSGGCYTSEDTCCKTCGLRRNRIDPTCPYGDSVSWCSSIRKNNCYNSDTAKRCCNTCGKFHTNIQGCEYGDLNNYCRKDYCQTSRKSECCLTCHQEASTTQSTTTQPSTTQSTTTQSTTTQSSTTQSTMTHKLTTPPSTAQSTTTEPIIGKQSPIMIPTTTPTPPPTVVTTFPNAPILTTFPRIADELTTTKLSFPETTTEAPSESTAGTTTEMTTEITTEATSESTAGTTTEITTELTTEATSESTAGTTTEVTTEITTTEGFAGCDSDKASWCNRIKPSQCYQSDDVCCRTCSNHVLNKKSECRYGNRASWCASYIKNEKQCERKDIAKICCDACSKMIDLHVPPIATTQKPSKPNCVNKAGWCSTMSKNNCYVSNIEKTCCETCSIHHNKDNPDCEYGDKYSWCPKMKAQGRCRSLEKDCCVSCS